MNKEKQFKVTITLPKDAFVAFKNLLQTNHTSIIGQLSAVSEAASKELDLNAKKNLDDYAQKLVMELNIVDSILEGLPKISKLEI